MVMDIPQSFPFPIKGSACIMAKQQARNISELYHDLRLHSSLSKLRCIDTYHALLLVAWQLGLEAAGSRKNDIDHTDCGRWPSRNHAEVAEWFADLCWQT